MKKAKSINNLSLWRIGNDSHHFQIIPGFLIEAKHLFPLIKELRPFNSGGPIKMNQIFLKLISFLSKTIVANQKTDIVTNRWYRTLNDNLVKNLA